MNQPITMSQVSIVVSRIVLITGRGGTDLAMLEVSLPDGCYPFQGNAKVDLHLAAGTGEAYCREHFCSVPTEVINR